MNAESSTLRPVQRTSGTGVPPPPAEGADEARCPTCDHPVGAHDEIALRFCAATEAGGLDRRCLCAGWAGDVGVAAPVRIGARHGGRPSGAGTGTSG
ncbi:MULTISPECIES: RGCVC family protein [Actinosynnema]|uniref:Uncharacterized protein n=2 Tax=Actinosynnema TaxID=40566 RepID=C6WQ78_ACTMD|nr:MULTISPECIES: RGCVC family protein [Actinosynnema]ACU36732.1 hypothetical protein Amir_2800 [Actinosynnema mirum DSM 43827]MCP2092150.1 hypothetical protein [Actinosynnema pretiosum]QUF05652.1 RGCVC family protein [Actinosynnema pretiosum subsp. pretiosum]